MKLNTIFLVSLTAIWDGKFTLLLKIVLSIWLIKWTTPSLLVKSTEKIILSFKFISPKFKSLLTVKLFSSIIKGSISKTPVTIWLFSPTNSVNSISGW